MSRLLDGVTGFLDARGWPVAPDGDMIRTLVRTEDQEFACAIVVVESVGQLVVYSIHPDVVDPECRSRVGEYVNRANASLTVGNLEIELDAGQVRFRTGLAVGDSPVTDEMIERVIFDNAATAVTCFPLVGAVAASELSPVEAVAAMRPES